MKYRLDQAIAKRGLISTRSQAESQIRLGKVKVNDRIITKPGFMVSEQDKIKLADEERYVSRAALKLASVAKALKPDFRDKIVLDVGSSTGGFTDFALQHGASKVIAVDVGTNQLHPSLRGDTRIDLYEKTDILTFLGKLERKLGVDIVLADLSFVSLRRILPDIAKSVDENTQILAMVKPQFEAGKEQINRGVIKNDKLRRQILRDFEAWAKKLFVIIDKADSDVKGAKGNTERFYLLKIRP